MDDFSNLSDEDIEQLMALGIAPEQLDALKEQMTTAQSLRDRKAPRGQTVGPDSVYVAASPLEHLAYAMQGIKAGKDLEGLRKEQQGILAQQVRGRGNYFKKLIDTPQRRAGMPFMQDPGMDDAEGYGPPQANY